jgi:phosphoribosylformylglycinamidine synthase subunit PurQ / glutaminase
VGRNVRVLILRAAGTNCDVETAHAWRLAGADTDTLHVKRILAEPAGLRSFDILTLPGGFSYGDDLGAGTILAAELMQSAGDELRRFIAEGKLILGICNGFQVLVKAGLLPDPQSGARTVTLAGNASGRFEARWVRLRTGRTACRFLPPDTVLELPVAHAEGRLVCRDEGTQRALIEGASAALCYVGANEGPCEYPANPNGSAGDIAGLTDPSGQVLGLMPHPERFVAASQHPLWTQRGSEREPDGLLVFRSAVAALNG